jgi:hypothetical protein
VPTAHIIKQLVDQLPLAGPSEEPRRTRGDHLSTQPRRAERARGKGRPSSSLRADHDIADLVAPPERWGAARGIDQGIHGRDRSPEPRL